MNPETAPSPQLFFETINAFHKTGALKAAVELDFFTAIGQTKSTAAEIAKRCQCPERGIRILSDTLTIHGFLTKEDGRYALTPDSAFFLDRNSPAYVGGSVEFFLSPSMIEGFSDLAATTRKGRIQQSELGTIEHDHPVWVKFARAMGPMMVLPAKGAAALVPLDASRHTRILDVAAGHGMYGIAFAEKNPRAHLVALDWEAVLTVTAENARAAGLGGRFSTIVGDAFTVELGEGYDLVLIPNFLHHFNRDDCVRFLKRVRGALRPDGRAVIVEFVPHDDRVTPPATATFALVMLGTTPEGDAYTFAEYRSMLTEAEFGEVALHALPPTTASAIIAA